MRGFRSDDQRRAMFAQLNCAGLHVPLEHGSFASLSNRFSAYPSDNVLSTPPQYVYTEGYDNSMDRHFSEAPGGEAEERAGIYKKLAATYKKAEARTKDTGLKAKLDIEGKILEKKAADLEDSELYTDDIDDAKRDLEIIRRGGIVYVTPPDSEEEFRKFEAEQRKKFGKDKFAEVPKKEGKQTIFGVALGSDELSVSDRELTKEKEISNRGIQVHFGSEFKQGRKVR